MAFSRKNFSYCTILEIFVQVLYENININLYNTNNSLSDKFITTMNLDGNKVELQEASKTLRAHVHMLMCANILIT